jgi:type IV secretion system protein VirD4
MTNTQIRITGIVSVLFLIVAINSYCTQFVAGRLAYHPALGSPLFNQFYEPFAWWKWMFKFHDYAPTTYSYAFLIFMGGALSSLLVLKFIVGLTSRKSNQQEGVHGTARFATIKDIRKAGLLPEKGEASAGVYCGGFDNPEMDRTEYLRHDGPEHCLVVAPTQSGKGVGLVIPTLLSWPHSMFVRDIKRELFEISSGWRRKHANNKILRYEPAHPTDSCAWNVIEEIRRDSHQTQDIQNLCGLLVDVDGTGKTGTHKPWIVAAEELLFGLILHLLYKSPLAGRTPTLTDCCNALKNQGIFAAKKDSKKTDNNKESRPLAQLLQEMSLVVLSDTYTDQVAQSNIRGIGSRFLETAPKEMSGVLSTALNALSLYMDENVGKNTSKSDFRISDLMDGDSPVTLYFITPPNDLERLRPLERLLLAQIIFRLTGSMEFKDGRALAAHKHRLLLMLDELPSLGKLEVFESALAYIAGYGIKAYIIIQDYQQLYAAYGQFESITSNCRLRAI